MHPACMPSTHSCPHSSHTGPHLYPYVLCYPALLPLLAPLRLGTCLPHAQRYAYCGYLTAGFLTQQHCMREGPCIIPTQTCLCCITLASTADLCFNAPAHAADVARGSRRTRPRCERELGGEAGRAGMELAGWPAGCMREGTRARSRVRTGACARASEIAEADRTNVVKRRTTLPGGGPCHAPQLPWPVPACTSWPARGAGPPAAPCPCRVPGQSRRGGEEARRGALRRIGRAHGQEIPLNSWMQNLQARVEQGSR